MSLNKIGLILLLAVGTVFGQENPGKVHGYVFGDFFSKLSGDSTGTGSQYQGVHKKQAAFQIRRVYLYYEHDISENFHATFLLESNDKALDGSGRHDVFVKLANLEWKNLIPGSSLVVGMIPTPTWAVSEKIWSYRSIEKTIMDFRGLSSASDIGVSVKGKIDGDGNFGYHMMAANGNGQKPEDNKTKKYYGSVYAKPIKGLTLELYTDFENNALNKQKKYTADKRTFKGLTAYQTEKFTVGLESFMQIQKHGTDSTDIKPFGVSAFAWLPIIEKVQAFGRYDLYNPDTELTKSGYNESFLTLGLDYMPVKNVHIMPNIWLASFAKKASTVSKRDADMVARITLFYIYK